MFPGFALPNTIQQDGDSYHLVYPSIYQLFEKGGDSYHSDCGSFFSYSINR